MTSVDLLLQGERIGWIDFHTLPVRTPADFSCTPPVLVTFTQAQTIALELYQQVAQGRVGHYEWRKSPWWRSGLFRWLRRSVP
jgi:hypothetical protein